MRPLRPDSQRKKIMKSLFAGLLAAGAFSASFAASVESQVEKNVVTPVRQIIVEPAKNNVIKPTYDVFGKPIVTVTQNSLRALAQDEADPLVCVSQPDDECKLCKTQHPIIDKLAKDGYDAKIVLTKDYKGKEPVNRTPTLLFFNGDKLVKKIVGVTPYDTIIKTLRKPSVEL